MIITIITVSFFKLFIKNRHFVSEYLGELISLKELNNRMKKLNSNDHLYAMQLNSKAYLDSRNKGNERNWKV